MFQVTLETFANFNATKKEEVLLKPAPVVSANDKYSALRDLLGDDENVSHTDTISKNNDIIATDIAEDDDDFGEFVATPTVLPLQPIPPKSLLPGEDLNFIC